MCERDSRVRSILDRGYNSSRLMSKFNSLVSLTENKKLKPDTGNLPPFLVLSTCCSCLITCTFLLYRVQNKVPPPPEESFDTYCVFCSCLYFEHPFIAQTSASDITIETEGITTFQPILCTCLHSVLHAGPETQSFEYCTSEIYTTVRTRL